LRTRLKEEKGTKETLTPLLSVLGITCERSRTHTTQLERREEEEGEGGLSRFGGCEPI